LKIIVSHDIDHLHGLEHWRDVYWPGVWYRGAKALGKGQIGLVTYWKRAWPLQRLERIKEVLELDRSVGATPTFFVGVANGLRLSYSRESIKPHIDYLLSQKVPVGLHGMAYDDPEKMKEEYEVFLQLAGGLPAGIRNHYLRQAESTLNDMSDIGYRFDSTTYELNAPYRVNEMWEFPISLMDVSLGIDSSLKEKQAKSMQVYKNAAKKELPYFVLNFHDNYFSDAYPTMKDWYKWFLQHLAKSHTFINFENAILEINKNG
jgi:hypothetical protein